MKRFFTLILLTISLFTPFAQTNSTLDVVESLYYDRNVYIASAEERAKLNDIIAQMRADSTLKIHIIGYCDKWGGKEVNDRFSYVRAMCIADWMCSHNVQREQITFLGKGIDTLAANDKEARRVEILREIEIVDIVPEPIIEIVAEPEPEPQPDPVTPQPEPEPEPEPTPVEIKNRFEWKNFTLRTNLLYWAAGMMNLGVEYKQPDSNFGFVFNGGYSFFGNTNWNHNFGGWFVAPEVRCYLPCNERWFVGAQFLAGGFNYKPSDTGSQGTVISGGVMGGYKLTLTDRFDMDFTLGVGYGHLKYDTYYHHEPTNNNPRIETDLVINSIMPIQAGVNLIWKIK